jgi:hypothetical protein
MSFELTKGVSLMISNMSKKIRPKRGFVKKLPNGTWVIFCCNTNKLKGGDKKCLEQESSW